MFPFKSSKRRKIEKIIKGFRLCHINFFTNPDRLEKYRAHDIKILDRYLKKFTNYKKCPKFIISEFNFNPSDTFKSKVSSDLLHIENLYSTYITGVTFNGISELKAQEYFKELSSRLKYFDVSITLSETYLNTYVNIYDLRDSVDVCCETCGSLRVLETEGKTLSMHLRMHCLFCEEGTTLTDSVKILKEFNNLVNKLEI